MYHTHEAALYQIGPLVHQGLTVLPTLTGKGSPGAQPEIFYIIYCLVLYTGDAVD